MSLAGASFVCVGVRKYTDEQLIEVLPHARNILHLLELLGVYPRGGNYETVRKRIKALDLDASHLGKRRSHWSFSDEELSEAVRSSLSMAETMRNVGLRPGSGGRRSLKRRIEELELDTSHLRVRGGVEVVGSRAVTLLLSRCLSLEDSFRHMASRSG